MNNHRYTLLVTIFLIILSASVFAAPTINSFSIENNAVYTNKEKPTLNISATDANGMAFSCSQSGPFTPFTAYASTYADFNFNGTSFGCSTADGNKFAFIKLEATDGTATIGSDSIILDTAKPSITTDENSGWQSTDANIRIACTDPLSGCDYLKVNSTNQSFNDQNTYYHIVSTDGNNAVTIEAFDKAGNTKQKTIYALIDKSGPTINNNTPSTDTNNMQPTIAFDVNDSGSGYKTMALAVDGNNVAPTITAFGKHAHVSFALPYTANNRSIKVDVNAWDNLDKNTLHTWSFNIDTIAPANPNTKINSNNSYTNSTSVTINIDSIGAAQCGIKNDSDSTLTFQNYSTGMPWTLASSDGTRTVTVVCRDSAGNYSAESTDTILLDRAAPSAFAALLTYGDGNAICTGERGDGN